MVEFKDGGIIAQLGTPDMRLPIQYALYYPHRRYLNGDRLDFAKLGQIPLKNRIWIRSWVFRWQFRRQKQAVPCRQYLMRQIELAVSKFLHKKIRFLDIYDIYRTVYGTP